MNTPVNSMGRFASWTAAAIATKLVDELLTNHTWAITVNDGEEDTLADSRDRQQILDALCTTDHDYVRVYRTSDGKCIGWAMLIWQNEADVISDYAPAFGELNDALVPVFEYIDQVTAP